MKTLREEVNEIKSASLSRTAKKSALAKLGITPYEISLMLASEATATMPRTTFTFGVEIECNVARGSIREAAATTGSVKTSNCHPFRRGNVFFAHNGVLSIQPTGDMTDSETAFEKYIYPAIAEYGYADSMKDYVISNIIGGSKFAMMRLGDRNVKLYGDYIMQPDGCYYSNLRFRMFMGNYAAM